jgi:hypothetical protein
MAGCMVAASPWLIAEFLDLLLGMACDDLVLDLVIRTLGKNAASDELVFSGVWAAVDDALGVGISDAGEGLELVGRGGVNVERCSRCNSRSRCWFGSFGGLGNIENRDTGEQESGGDQLAAKIEHRRVSLYGLNALLRKSTRACEARQ